MEILGSIGDVRAWQGTGRGSVGLVPTMGALHAGHMALVTRARSENDRVIVSIFVNPKQFGPHEDYDRYPQDLESDQRLLVEAGVDAVFLPAVEQIYPEGFATSVEVTGPLTAVLEGAARPGHFNGVVTVVTKLFSITQPTRAYFGMKDAQQLLVIHKLVQDLSLPLDLVAVTTVREPDGVALSSRNRYLSRQERAAAAAIPRALDRSVALFEAGVRDGAVLRRTVEEGLAGDALLAPEYVSCAAIDDLRELQAVGERALLSIAVRAGGTRLIDNRWLGVPEGASPLD